MENWRYGVNPIRIFSLDSGQVRKSLRKPCPNQENLFVKAVGLQAALLEMDKAVYLRLFAGQGKTGNSHAVRLKEPLCGYLNMKGDWN